MIEWEELSEPRFLEDSTYNVCNIAGFRLEIKRNIYRDKNKWYFDCNGVTDGERCLDSEKLSEAKCQAIAIFREELQDALDELRESK